MADLYPTKTRLHILAAAEKGNIARKRGDVGAYDYTLGAVHRRRVAVKVEEMVFAGLLKYSHDDMAWYPTPAGRRVLAEHQGES